MTFWVITGFVAGGILSGVFVYLITRKVFISKQHIALKQAKIKAIAIEKEAEIKFQNQRIKLKEEEIELRKKYENEICKAIKGFEEKSLELDKKEFSLSQKSKSLDEERRIFEIDKNSLLLSQQAIDDLKLKYQEKQNKLIEILSNYTALSIDEAKSMLLVHLRIYVNQ